MAAPTPPAPKFQMKVGPIRDIKFHTDVMCGVKQWRTSDSLVGDNRMTVHPIDDGRGGVAGVWLSWEGCPTWVAQDNIRYIAFQAPAPEPKDAA